MKLNDLKTGDLVLLDDEGVEREGTVVRISKEEHEALIDNGVQEFWYPLDKVKGIPLSDGTLKRFGFEQLPNEHGPGIKYGKGPFRLVVPGENDFSSVEVWYREDRRHFDHPISINDLQNIHLQMTKVHLEL